ncbi:MAG: AAA family ATPase [Stigonema ocellatum SAG 48.90 = DSM 106950]|nr:AAA family ATPase [Stigonema ocellatum SAG 48.90 = DSM 106950]
MSYYISPRFLDKIAIHITKNFLDVPGLRVPLILGVHGRKGEGKSFQCELIFQHMGIEPVRMSAGELESPDAGDPVRLIRMRYREAAELIKVRGKMCVLLINDLDAGAGRVDTSTQYTVNTQLVNGTLMNIADNPTDVQLPGSYDTQPIHRVPIIVTGNDFSTLYAPLVRDGRMEKFYWEPNQEDRIGIVAGIFAEDGVSQREVERLIETFPNQSIDFFSALRSRVYDEQVRKFIHQVGLSKVSVFLANNPGTKINFQKGNFGLDRLIELGNLLVYEQQRLQNMQLVRQYVTGASNQEQRVKESTMAESNYQLSQVGSSTVLLEAPTMLNNGGSGSVNVNGLPNGVSVSNLEHLLEQGIRQGGRLTLEVANPREKSRNSWRTWKWKQAPENAAKAIAEIRDCLHENPGSFVKLVGYNPKTQTRTLEEIIFRP